MLVAAKPVKRWQGGGVGFVFRREQNTGLDLDGLDLNRSRLAPVAWVRRRLYFCDTADAGQWSLLINLLRSKPRLVHRKAASSRSSRSFGVLSSLAHRRSRNTAHHMKNANFYSNHWQRLSLRPSLDYAAFSASLLGCTPHQE